MRTKCYVLNENESCRDYLGAANLQDDDNFSIENELRIEVYKGARTFGLALCGGINDQRSPGNSSIYVEKVLEGGLAEKDGRIMPGDRITAIKQYLEDGDARTYNFDDYGTATKEDAKQILRRCKGRVAVFIVRNEDIKEDSEEKIVSSLARIGEVVHTNISQKVSCDPNSLSNDANNAIDTTYSHDHSHDQTDELSASSLKQSSKSYLHDLHKPIQINNNCMRLINLAPLHPCGSWPTARSQNLYSACSMDYRDMAKYGVRPTSNLRKEMLPRIDISLNNHRIKRSWGRSEISRLSITEDDEEEEPYDSSMMPVQKIFELEMEQHVL